MADSKQDLEQECSICEYPLDADKRRPVVGTCGHSLCIACRLQLRDRHFQCPFCMCEGAFVKEVTNYKLVGTIQNVGTQFAVLVNRFLENEEVLTALLMSEKEENARCAQKLESTFKDYETVKVELEAVKLSTERTVKQLEEKIKALTKVEGPPRWRCSECNNLTEQDKSRVPSML